MQQAEKKIQRALDVLSVLQRPQTLSILSYLQEHGSSAFIDVMVHFPEMDVEDELERMSAAGLIYSENQYYTTHYRINREKLLRVYRLAKALPESAPVNAL
ncbi:MAG: hypothetical protein IPH16_07780 [Haliscomenobacter sp.]|nr:hypothetical protein [Haliscomenobacter sp.]MBK7475849.1 hypothetical protein [Haliscomenobacter sp.]MBK8879242.1 hypothetical protein [Haliscomenobacter sp.]